MIKIFVSLNLFLKELTVTDAPNLFAAINDNRDFLSTWLPWVVTTTTTADSLGFIQFTQVQRELGKSLSCGIWHDGKLVGTVSLVDINQERRTAEIGYWIVEAEQGQGIVTNACKKLMRYAFERRDDIDQIIIRCVTANSKSFNLINRLHLSCESIFEPQWAEGCMQETAVTRGSLSKKDWQFEQSKQSISPFEFWVDEHPASPTIGRIPTVDERLVGSLYSFEINRRKYKLCPSNIGFFQPFKTPSDVQQQLKTTLVSPLVGLFSIAPNIIYLIKSMLIMAVSIPCISPSLFIEGLVDSLAVLSQLIVTPLVASVVTLASLVSMVTRTIATVFSYDSGEFKNDLFPFLPENPYKGVSAMEASHRLIY